MICCMALSEPLGSSEIIQEGGEVCLCGVYDHHTQNVPAFYLIKNRYLSYGVETGISLSSIRIHCITHSLKFIQIMFDRVVSLYLLGKLPGFLFSFLRLIKPFTQITGLIPAVFEQLLLKFFLGTSFLLIFRRRIRGCFPRSGLQGRFLIDLLLDFDVYIVDGKNARERMKIGYVMIDKILIVNQRNVVCM